MKMAKLNERQWRETPYALSKANDPDRDLLSLLEKYGIAVHQVSQVVGPHGRPAVVLRFFYKQLAFRIAYEILDAPDVDLKQRVKQVKRAMYWMLKSRLEEAGVFGTAEELMCGWLELPDGKTIYEASEPFIRRLPSPDFVSKVFGLLPPSESKP
jgi:hypothetical protein